jgi:transcription termination/antitermination protein NusG
MNRALGSLPADNCQLPAAGCHLGEGTSPKWYVLWTRSQCEQMVHDELSAKGFQLFLPTLDVWVRRNGTRRRVTSPMFSGYLFLNHVMSKTSYIEVTNAHGLVKILGERWDALAEVPDSEIATIRRINQNGVPVASHPYLQLGERVRIVKGLLEGVEGILVRTKPEKGFVVVSVNLLQRSVAVEVDYTLVAPI